MSYFREMQQCGLCYLGPCLCAKQKAQPMKQQIIQPGHDDHVWNKAPGAVRAATIAFVNTMREEINFGVEWRRERGISQPGDKIRKLIVPGTPEWNEWTND